MDAGCPDNDLLFCVGGHRTIVAVVVAAVAAPEKVMLSLQGSSKLEASKGVFSDVFFGFSWRAPKTAREAQHVWRRQYGQAACDLAPGRRVLSGGPRPEEAIEK